MQGRAITLQPFILPNGNVFCYNGEVFGGLKAHDIESCENDGRVLADQLTRGENLRTIMPLLDGPYAFVYYDALEQKLHFGRDFLGRRSLMRCEYDASGQFLLSSVSCPIENGEWSEIGTDGFYSLDIPSMEHSIIRWMEDIPSPFRNSINRDITADYLMKCNFDHLPEPTNEYQRLLHAFKDLILDSVRRRAVTAPTPKDGESRVSIMFSGGLDCTVLAALCHLCLPQTEPIDLLNVAFENPRYIQNQKFSPDEMYNVPDRLTGLASFQELQQRFAERQWRFVQINVTFEEYTRTRHKIAGLMFPSNTVMDLSIASAFYFASRGQGHLLLPDSPPQPYISKARIVLSGLGADELLGGYSHHQKAFLSPLDPSTPPHVSLLDALEHDLRRLPTRNLGRDDRIISSHGKELRLPFLSHHIVNFCCDHLPLNFKCDLRAHVPKGIGEKLFLRMFARWVLGMAKVAVEKKRAVQFGARTAKLTDGKERGEDIIKLDR